jgi:hypothetical protein
MIGHVHARERATRRSTKGVRALGRAPAERLADDLFRSLQRSVGNRAVTLLVQRAPKDRPTSTDAPGRRRPPNRKEAPPKKAAADIRARVIRYAIVNGEGLITIASGTDQGVRVGMSGSLVKSDDTEYADFTIEKVTGGTSMAYVKATRTRWAPIRTWSSKRRSSSRRPSRARSSRSGATARPLLRVRSARPAQVSRSLVVQRW